MDSFLLSEVFDKYYVPNNHPRLPNYLIFRKFYDPAKYPSAFFKPLPSCSSTLRVKSTYLLASCKNIPQKHILLVSRLKHYLKMLQKYTCTFFEDFIVSNHTKLSDNVKSEIIENSATS